jgi:hypothetical protein
LQGGGVQSHGTHGGAGAIPIRETRSGATGHMAAPEPTSIGRQSLVLQGTWRRVDGCLAPYLDSKLVPIATVNLKLFILFC